MIITTSWLTYSTAAVLLLGVSMALYKMPSFKGYSSFHSTLWVNIFYFLIALAVLVLFGVPSSLFTISWYGLLWGVFFAVTMLQQKLLLKRAETNTLLPVTSSLGGILTIGVGVLLFSETISLTQMMGILVIFTSVFLFSRKKGEFPLDINSITLSLGIITASTITKYIQKIGATHDAIFHFALYQSFGAMLFSLILIYIFEKHTIPKIFEIKHTWKTSLVIAVFSTTAGYALLKALSIGPLSGVYAIQPSYIFVTAIIGVILYKEVLTVRKIALMVLSIIGIIFIKIG